MGKFRACAVTFRQGQEVFRDGERVSGVVMLDVGEAVVVRGVRVYCYGESLTKWSKDFSRDINTDQVTCEKYFAQVYNLFGKKQNEEGPNHTLTVGKHRWNFAFRLPAERLPSSLEGQYGAIRWFLKVEVDKPFPSINNKWYKPFTVLSQLDLNEPVYQPPIKKEVSKTVSKALGIGNAGTLTLFAQTDHFGYSPGEAISIKVEAKNDSTKDMGKIIIMLVQTVNYTANDETKSSSLGVASLQTELTLAKGTTVTLTDIQLRVPAVPPSTRKRTCHNITCTYTVKVGVHVPWGLDLEAVIPVAIGTVPRGFRLPRSRPAQSQAAAGGTTSPPIRYVKCEAGITPCTKSHNTFPNLPFTPFTAYLPPDFTPTATPTPAPSSASAASSSSTSPAQQQQQMKTKATETMMAPSAISVGSTAGMGSPPDLPAYSPPSAPIPEMDLPPAYEDVMRVEEEERAAAAQTPAATTATPEGRKCVIMLARFPDGSLPSFRQTIRREQNNLLDSEDAFLAALAPQPLTSLEKPQDFWPDHYALALLVFPDTDSAEEWVRGVTERGDAWYSESDVLMMPASWSVPSDVSERLVFSITVAKVRDGVSKEQLTSVSKTVIPDFTQLRQRHGGVRQSMSKKTTALHGKWVSSEYTVSICHWPKVRNYLTFFLEADTGEYAKKAEELRTLFESQHILLLSEDVTSLSTQSATSPDDDVTPGDDDGDEEENVDDESARVENLLGRESGRQQQAEDQNSDE